jgi:ubiquinone/menaquinone biosynthesis C-methylase UbiE
MNATPERIFQTLLAFQSAGALKGAIDLDLFTAIGGGATSVPAIAAACSASERGIRILCDYLAIGGFLTKSGDAYGLTEESAAFLDKRSPVYLGSVAIFLGHPFHREAASDVAKTVRTGTSILDANKFFDIEHEAWIRFAEGMAPMMMPAAHYMASLVDAPKRVLDIAAGHGIFGIMTAAQHQTAVIDALDWAGVLAVARGNASKFGVSDRWNAIEGSAFDITPAGPYDAIYVTNFFHHFDKATCTGLMKKWRALLAPGGVMLTLEFIPNADRVTPPTSAAFPMTMLLNTPSGDAYTFAEYNAMLREAGFASNELHQVPNSPQQLIVSK